MLVALAAGVVAMVMRPAAASGARQYFAEGTLLFTGSEEPELYIECLESGDVIVRRTALTGVYSSGAVSLAVTLTGFDLRIEERITPGSSLPGTEVDTAIFTLDFLGRERYHILYYAGEEGRFIGFPLKVTPGLWTRKPLPVRS